MENVKSISTECYPCLFQQLLSLAKLMRLDEKSKKGFIEKTMSDLLETHGEGIIVQHLIRKATDTINEMLGKPHDHDPYRSLKIKSNDIALQYRQIFKDKISASDVPLQTAIKLAAAGNIIDFGAKNHAQLNIEEELDSVEQRGFGIFHFEAFAERLETAKNLLYICDNAGEIVLDKIFVEEIKASFPDLKIVCAVRDKPIINDAVLDDAFYIGLDQIVRVISSGSIYPGTILAETSDEFKTRFAEADLIIAKGQGNFETLLETIDDRLFFILRIKCEMMAKLAGTEAGNLVLMQNSAR
jgi:uncharacterized protein with ATP-grasp and redox domains